MWYAQYQDSDGALVVHGLVAPTAQAGMSVKSWADRPAGEWDAVAKDYDGVDNTPLLVGARDYIALFTADEFVAIEGSTNNNVKQLLAMVRTGEPVNLKSPRVSLGLDLLIALGIIDAARKTAILANQEPT